LNVGEAEFVIRVRDPWSVEEQERVPLAGSQLSGKILEKVKTDPERFWSGAVCVQFM
jgi:hypothetical protein